MLRKRGSSTVPITGGKGIGLCCRQGALTNSCWAQMPRLDGWQMYQCFYLLIFDLKSSMTTTCVGKETVASGQLAPVQAVITVSLWLKDGTLRCPAAISMLAYMLLLPVA